MKKIIIAFLSLGLLFSCNNSSRKEKNDKNEVKDITEDPVYKKGLALVANPDNKCLTCHTIDDKFTGPPYREVANKYASYPDTIVKHLANKIIHGGNGVWGEIYMTPNSNVSQEDAEAMVKYILLLKK